MDTSKINSFFEAADFAENICHHIEQCSAVISVLSTDSEIASDKVLIGAISAVATILDIVDSTACQLSTFLMHQKNIKQTKEF